ncbi:nitroreductase family protein [Leptolinea tardivitalis]|uniref:Nitroreductase n=1 Tax=Leptolinea tardivitalis TaxID=229920 RepID=A0A0P6XF18_9CHLR|nr:nitroreductase family protein [Leptolinea tardivitalis]KPL73408.1 nitroreductase [Leptolinea tardivitalis]GAP21562.1 nitroreductase [Leptolinea tardivitalis]
MLKDLVLRNRSYRRFNQTARINPAVLRDLCDLARLTPSGRNAQPLKYILVTSEDLCDKIYPLLGWAGYLKDWDGPIEGERPAAYIVMLGDKTISENFGIDPGIACQTLLLGAVEQGLGGCIIATVKRENLKTLLEIPDTFDVLYVIALGKPVEEVVVEPVGSNGDIKYWRDDKHVHHVPKRELKDVIVAEK